MKKILTLMLFFTYFISFGIPEKKIPQNIKDIIKTEYSHLGKYKFNIHKISKTEILYVAKFLKSNIITNLYFSEKGKLLIKEEFITSHDIPKNILPKFADVQYIIKQTNFNKNKISYITHFYYNSKNRIWILDENGILISKKEYLNFKVPMFMVMVTILILYQIF